MRSFTLTRYGFAAVLLLAGVFLACNAGGCAGPAVSCTADGQCDPLPLCASTRKCVQPECVWTVDTASGCECYGGDTRGCTVGNAPGNSGTEHCEGTVVPLKWGSCVPNCLGSPPRCNGNRIESCDPEEGWKQTAACAAPTPTCVNGACAGDTCADDDVRCKPGEAVVQKCTGNAWNDVETCGRLQVCSDAKCVGCVNGDPKCEDLSTVAVCRDGVWTTELCEPGKGCVGGDCVPLTGRCAPGDEKCDGNVAIRCAAPDPPNYPGGLVRTNCTESGDVCVDPPDASPRCVDCQPDSKQECIASNRCNGERTCSAAGTWTSCDARFDRRPAGFAYQDTPGPLCKWSGPEAINTTFRGADLDMNKELAAVPVPAECNAQGADCEFQFRLEAGACEGDSKNEALARVICEGHEADADRGEYWVELTGSAESTIHCEAGKRVILRSVHRKLGGGCGGGNNCEARFKGRFSARAPACLQPR